MADSLLADFLTGATGLASLASGGAVPIYGESAEPLSLDSFGLEAAERRRAVLLEAGGNTAAEIAADPAKVLKVGTKVIVKPVGAAVGAVVSGGTEGLVEGAASTGGLPLLGIVVVLAIGFLLYIGGVLAPLLSLGKKVRP